MKFIEVGRKLTEEVVNGLKRTEYYLDGNSEFAMLSDNVFVILEKSKVSDGTDAICEEVYGFIDEVLSNPPDFNSYLMDDGYIMVIVGGVYAFDRVKTSKEEYDDRNIRFQRSLRLRDELLEACENKTITAIAEIINNN